MNFVNAHTHIYSGLAPFGMPEPAEAPRNFVQILERIWWRLDRALDARALRVSARWYVAEALRLGTVLRERRDTEAEQAGRGDRRQHVMPHRPSSVRRSRTRRSRRLGTTTLRSPFRFHFSG